jgi:hypothetical protein
VIIECFPILTTRTQFGTAGNDLSQGWFRLHRSVKVFEMLSLSVKSHDLGMVTKMLICMRVTDIIISRSFRPSAGPHGDPTDVYCRLARLVSP